MLFAMLFLLQSEIFFLYHNLILELNWFFLEQLTILTLYTHIERFWAILSKLFLLNLI
jgi:hypothetical protein